MVPQCRDSVVVLCPMITYHAETPQPLRVCVRVRPVGQQAGVVAMDDVVNAMLGEQFLDELRGQVIGHACVSCGGRQE